MNRTEKAAETMNALYGEARIGLTASDPEFAAIKERLKITQAYYDRQFEKAELATMQQKAKAKAEKLGIEFIPAGDGQSA